MVILVTGGTGYIGAHLVSELVKRGEKVIAYDFAPYFEAVKDLNNVKIIKGDITDLSQLLHAIKKEQVNLIVHTAALLTDESERAPLAALKINLEGTVNCLEVARLTDLPRVVYISSRAVYGYTPIGQPLDEDYPKQPVSIYGITKLASEYFGQNYANNYGIDFIALRLSLVYGLPRAPIVFRGVSGIIMEMIQKSAIGMPVKISKGGDGAYDLIYIKDVIQAIVLACYTKGLKHRIFNIGSGELIKLKDIAEIIKKTIPNAKIEIGSGELIPTARGPLDTTRAQTELGFKCKYTIEKGVLESLRNAKFFESSRSIKK
ncbi:MAG: NAD(P)-dependent oxidoreductase [Nitrososphaerales archaeon]